jgi:hypothetical protein
MLHVLKIWPQFFCRVQDGSKTFEVRNNDRGFQPGDEVLLQEYVPSESGVESHNYTGKSLKFRIGYVLPVDAERVAFSLLPLPEKA